MPEDLSSSFWKNGYLFPIQVFSPEEAAMTRIKYEEYLKLYGQGAQRRIRGNRIFRVHVLADWAAKIVKHPKLVAAVSACLGSKNILCWSSDLAVKNARSTECFGWHQDEAYADLHPHTKVLTAWVAITRANRNNACVRYIRGSHMEGTLAHNSEQRTKEKNLVLGQTVANQEWVKEREVNDVVRSELEAGEAALHSWRTVHSSEANQSDEIRVGLAIRYMTAEARQESPVVKDWVTLVNGEFTGDWFELERQPGEGEQFSKECWDQHKLSLDREWERRKKSKQLGMLPSQKLKAEQAD